MKLLSLTTVVASLLTGVFAHSSVYLVSSNANELSTKPEFSMDAFSMFYSHMMGSSLYRPVLKLQDNDAIQDITTLLPQTNNLFEPKLEANLVVIVTGAQNPEAILSSYESSFYVNDDNADNYADVIEDSIHNEDIILTTYKNQITRTKKGDSLEESVDTSVKNFEHDFGDFSTDSLDINRVADQNFIIEMETIKELVQAEKPKGFDVTIIQINTLEKLGEEYGFESAEYKEAQLVMKGLFEKFIIPNFQSTYSHGVSTFILTPYSKQTLNKRGVPDLISEGETCFTSAKACKSGTSNCSGNGKCVPVGESCYACQCRSSNHVGDSCQYVNAVGDFQLLFWSSVLLIVITTSVVVCVYQSGSDADAAIILTQSAPKQD